jgi:crossover junction endodeoxyribonuclease RuvC
VLSLGLDISSTSTGVVFMNDISLVPIDVAVLVPPPGLTYVERADWQANKLLGMLDEHGWPDRIMIEGYSLGSTNGAEPLITVGGIIRYILYMASGEMVCWMDVAPMRLKKYAHAKLKQDMKLAVFKRWGFEHSSDDAIDGYVLAMIGVALDNTNTVGLTQAQLEVLDGLANPKPKAKKTKKAV